MAAGRPPRMGRSALPERERNVSRLRATTNRPRPPRSRSHPRRPNRAKEPPRARVSRSRPHAPGRRACRHRPAAAPWHARQRPIERRAGLRPQPAGLVLRARECRRHRRDGEREQRRPDCLLEPDQQSLRRHRLPGQSEAGQHPWRAGLPEPRGAPRGPGDSSSSRRRPGRSPPRSRSARRPA